VTAAAVFSECFRRIAPARYSPISSFHHFQARFISTLYNFPGTYQGGTFCPSLTEWNFLDGGISSQNGYGSTSSWTVVRGTEALRVICLFHGIEQPKRLPGETDRRPLAAILEDLSKVPCRIREISSLEGRPKGLFCVSFEHCSEISSGVGAASMLQLPHFSDNRRFF